MVQDRHNLVPVTLAVLLHVILFGSLFVVIDMGRRDHPAVPLAIKGALVTDNAVGFGGGGAQLLSGSLT